MRWWIGGLGAFAGVALAMFGCAPGAFTCSTDDQCGGGGRCEPATSYCSFPSESCESGWAYGAYAGGISESCVAPGDPAASTSTSTSTSTSSEDTTSSSTATTSASASTGTSASTTSTTSLSSASTGELISTGTGPFIGTTGGDQGLCVGDAFIEEQFESLPLDAMVWNESILGPAVAEILNDELHVAVDIPAGGEAGYWYAITLDSVPSAGVAGLEIVKSPDPMHPSQLYIGLETGMQLFYFSLDDAELGSRWRDPNGSYSVITSDVFDPVQHRWIRLAFDAEAAVIEFETSPNGVDWTLFDSVDASGFDFAAARLELAVGSPGPVSDPDLAAIDNLFLCGA